MKVFFESIKAIENFIVEIKSLGRVNCRNCSKDDQFISHGFVYKTTIEGEVLTVGKRIICSRRYNKNGCGRTFRLYLSVVIPRLHFLTHQLSVFIAALLSMKSIQASYESATGTIDPRNAYRWLNKVWERLSCYRTIIGFSGSFDVSKFKNRVRRLSLLLPTLQELSSKFSENLVQNFQLSSQSSFFE